MDLYRNRRNDSVNPTEQNVCKRSETDVKPIDIITDLTTTANRHFAHPAFRVFGSVQFKKKKKIKNERIFSRKKNSFFFIQN